MVNLLLGEKGDLIENETGFTRLIKPDIKLTEVYFW
jgi:hypothetical protein